MFKRQVRNLWPKGDFSVWLWRELPRGTSPVDLLGLHSMTVSSLPGA